MPPSGWNDHPGQQLGVEVGRFLGHHVAGIRHRGELVELGRADEDRGADVAAPDAVEGIGRVPSVGEPVPGGHIRGSDPEPVVEDRGVEQRQVEAAHRGARPLARQARRGGVRVDGAAASAPSR